MARPTLGRPTWASVLYDVRTLPDATYEALYNTTKDETLARYGRYRAAEITRKLALHAEVSL